MLFFILLPTIYYIFPQAQEILFYTHPPDIGVTRRRGIQGESRNALFLGGHERVFRYVQITLAKRVGIDYHRIIITAVILAVATDENE